MRGPSVQPAAWCNAKNVGRAASVPSSALPRAPCPSPSDNQKEESPAGLPSALPCSVNLEVPRFLRSLAALVAIDASPEASKHWSLLSAVCPWLSRQLQRADAPSGAGRVVPTASLLCRSAPIVLGSEPGKGSMWQAGQKREEVSSFVPEEEQRHKARRAPQGPAIHAAGRGMSACS